MQSLSQADVPSPEGQKTKRWNILKHILPATNTGGRPGEVTPPQSSSGSDKVSGIDSTNANGSVLMQSPMNDLAHPGLESNNLYQTFSFRFTLEWVNRPMFPSKNLELYTPRLPAAADNLLELRAPSPVDVSAIEPKGIPESSVKYAGRALAEWTKIVDECNNFFERRKEEGVPTDKLVETPLLVADSFQSPR